MDDLGVIVPVISVLLLAVSRFLELGRRRVLCAGRIRARWTLNVFLATGCTMVAVGIAECLWRGPPFRWPFFVLGWALGGASIALRWSAIRALGDLWSLHIETRSHHRLIEQGPFRWIRHPTYLSMVLEILSFTLILQAWYTGFVVLAILIPFLLVRIRYEEDELVAQLGGAYEKYRNRVPSLIPYRVRRRG